MITLLNPKLWLALALAAILAGAGWWAYGKGADSVQVKWDAVEKERSDQSAKVAADALALTKDLQASADTQQKVKDAQIAKLNRSLAAALDGLRNRAPRPGPGSLPGDPAAAAGPGCTGAQLYRPDSEFLTRESARANRLLADLQQCQTQYNAARRALSK